MILHYFKSQFVKSQSSYAVNGYKSNEGEGTEFLIILPA